MDTRHRKARGPPEARGSLSARCGQGGYGSGVTLEGELRLASDL